MEKGVMYLVAYWLKIVHPDRPCSETWGSCMKTVQPCRAQWPIAAQHRGRLWAGSGCWELRVSRSCPLIDDTICGSLPVRALNFGWRETFVWATKEKKASCEPVWSLGSTAPVGAAGGAAARGAAPASTWGIFTALLTWSLRAAEGSASAE